MSINYIDDDGVRQIFSDIKSNLDSINNTATSAYTTANSAYTKANTAYNTATSAYTIANSAYTTANKANNLAVLAYAGAITSDTNIFNIDGGKIFNITNGYFKVEINEAQGRSTFTLDPFGLSVITVNKANRRQDSRVFWGNNFINFRVSSRTFLNLTDKGIFINDGTHSGYINVANCI